MGAVTSVPGLPSSGTSRALPVPDGLEGQRVDQALSRLFGLTRTAAAEVADAGGGGGRERRRRRAGAGQGRPADRRQLARGRAPPASGRAGGTPSGRGND